MEGRWVIFLNPGMVVDMANAVGYGNPTMLSIKKAIYSILPDKPSNITVARKIPLNIVAAQDWDTSFANAQIFAKLPKFNQDRKVEKYRLASSIHKKTWSRSICKLHRKRPASNNGEQPAPTQ